ncbi:MAG: cysteine synthase family protein [Bacteroidota bacterium]|nr:cysteine synthase family protein [Bacteroidota bacterium]|tara:strand:- start:651 stop:1691 length:1041 start_codon:yes stop_codon:yes gene_type:complete
MGNSKKIANNILELVGKTPLVKLDKITSALKGEYYAKIEGSNPGHSSKDRIALYIIEEAERKGLLKPGSTIIETTSGNTGFSIAMVSIIKGYDCILAVTSKSSQDKIDMLKAMGANVFICPANVPADDHRSYYQVAKKMHEEIKGSLYINQYFNELNSEAHYKTTGPEIWKQTGGKLTHLVACSGTGGTISGIGKYLKEQNPNIKIIGVDAYGSVLKKYHETGEFDEEEIFPYRVEGLGKNLIPSVTDFNVIDKYEKVNDEDSAHSAREIVKKEGIFVGYTSGAAFQAIKQLNNIGEFKDSDKIVVVFPDHGSRYLSKIYSDKWMEDQGFFDSKHETTLKKIQYIK